MPAPRGNSGPSLGHVSGEVRVYPAGGTAAGRGIKPSMSSVPKIQSDVCAVAESVPKGPTIGLACRDDAIPGSGELGWLAPPRPGFESLPSAPPLSPEGCYLMMRRQLTEGVVEDRWEGWDPIAHVADWLI